MASNRNTSKVGMTTSLCEDSLGVAKLDRRVAVAPMMDWTDDRQTPLGVRCLRTARRACLLYVSSVRRRFTFSAPPFAAGNTPG